MTYHQRFLPFLGLGILMLLAWASEQDKEESSHPLRAASTVQIETAQPPAVLNAGEAGADDSTARASSAGLAVADADPQIPGRQMYLPALRNVPPPAVEPVAVAGRAMYLPATVDVVILDPPQTSPTTVVTEDVREPTTLVVVGRPLYLPARVDAPVLQPNRAPADHARIVGRTLLLAAEPRPEPAVDQEPPPAASKIVGRPLYLPASDAHARPAPTPEQQPQPKKQKQQPDPGMAAAQQEGRQSASYPPKAPDRPQAMTAPGVWVVGKRAYLPAQARPHPFKQPMTTQQAAASPVLRVAGQPMYLPSHLDVLLVTPIPGQEARSTPAPPKAAEKQKVVGKRLHLSVPAEGSRSQKHARPTSRH